MNHYSYCYSLVPYHHTDDLDELVNVGLMVHSAAMKGFASMRPKSLKWLELIYPGVLRQMVSRYYHYFEDRAQEIARERKDWWNSHATFAEFLDSEFLMPHTTSLQFGRVKVSMQNFNDFERLTEHLYHFHFAHYDRASRLKFERGFRGT